MAGEEEEEEEEEVEKEGSGLITQLILDEYIIFVVMDGPTNGPLTDK